MLVTNINSEVCADKNSENIDLVLHDSEGKEILRAQESNREPVVEYKPSKTETYYVAVYASKLKGGIDSSGVAMAVTYR